MTTKIKGTKTHLLKLSTVVREWKDMVPHMEMQLILVFIEVYLNPSQPMKFYADRVEISQSAISRAVAQLGQGASPSQPGLALVEASEDPYERRRKIVTITPKGDRLAERMIKTISGD